jgi:adenine-specific DNA methylase
MTDPKPPEKAIRCPSCGSVHPAMFNTVLSKEQPGYSDALLEYEWCSDKFHDEVPEEEKRDGE